MVVILELDYFLLIKTNPRKWNKVKKKAIHMKNMTVQVFLLWKLFIKDLEYQNHFIRDFMNLIIQKEN